MSTKTSTTTSRERWQGRLTMALWAFLVLPASCAKSQQGVGTEPGGREMDFDSLIWEEVPADETTRVAMDGFEVVEYQSVLADELWGRHEGHAEALVRVGEGQCLEIAVHADLDADGWKELVIKADAKCGGGCCPSQWAVLSYRGNGRYWRSAPFGAALHPPRLVTLKGKPMIEVENAKLDAYQTYATVEVLALEQEQLVQRAVQAPARTAVLSEVALGPQQRPAADSLVQLSYDLDADGKPDLVQGKYSAKWDRVYWSLQLGNGTLVDSGPPFRRLGVLPTVTKGFHDLLVDHDRIYVWNGKRYDVKED